MVDSASRLTRLKDLRASVKEARGGNSAIDRAFWCLENGFDKIEIDHDPWPRYYAHGPGKYAEVAERDIAPITASIDAVMPLFQKHIAGVVAIEIGFEPDLKEVWPAAGVRWYPRGVKPPHWHAEVGTAATLTLALLATVLEAMIHMEELQVSAASAAL